MENLSDLLEVLENNNDNEVKNFWGNPHNFDEFWEKLTGDERRKVFEVFPEIGKKIKEDALYENLISLLNTLKAEYPQIAGICLTGSYAKGYFSEESDLDCAIILCEEAAPVKSADGSFLDYEKILKNDVVNPLGIMGLNLEVVLLQMSAIDDCLEKFEKKECNQFPWGEENDFLNEKIVPLFYKSVVNDERLLQFRKKFLDGIQSLENSDKMYKIFYNAVAFFEIHIENLDFPKNLADAYDSFIEKEGKK